MLAEGNTIPATDSLTPARSRRRRWLCIALVPFILLLVAVVLDRLFPLHLPAPDTGSTVVLARDGSPRRAIADGDGVWRYPTTA
jgi:penicillin-binding protein 1C